MNFDLLLKPLLEAEARSGDRKIVQIFKGNHAFGLLQIKLIKTHPKKTPIHVISTHPKEWVDAMNESKKLQLFENIVFKKRASSSCLVFRSEREKWNEMLGIISMLNLQS